MQIHYKKLNLKKKISSAAPIRNLKINFSIYLKNIILKYLFSFRKKK